MKKYKCKICNKIFFGKPSAKRKYCSNKCYLVWFRKNNPMKRPEVAKKISDIKKGAGNPRWTGDNVSYGAVHGWLRRNHQKPDYCELCGKNKAEDLANITGEYKRDIKHYMWLCRKCHTRQDGRINNLGYTYKRIHYYSFNEYIVEIGGEKMKWKTIKCKGCGSNEGRMFQMQPSLSGDDVWCEKCKVDEMEKRAKA